MLAAAITANTGDGAMVKKARKSASKARKAKTSVRRKRPVAKARRKTGRKAAAPKRAKTVAKKARKKAAPKPSAMPHESFLQRVEGVVEAVLDTLTDAERLHHKLEPDISRDPE